MLPLALSAGLFLFLTVVGQALLAALKLRRGLLRGWLLSPCLGLAVISPLLMLGSQAGWPIRSFAWALAAALGVLSGAVLLWRRPIVPWRSLAPFLFAGLLFMFWTAWPAFEFGFHWISYVNADFTNYCLSAQRYMDFGFYRTPTLPELGGKDYSQWFWFMEVVSLARFGADQFLAWVASLCRANPIGIFMPTIVALGLAQIAAIAGLVLHAGRCRRQAQLTAVLLAFSPMFMLGCLYQLIAQAGGLALMMTFLALLAAPFVPENRWALARQSVPLALVGTAVGLFYPEVVPFALLGFGLFLAIRWIQTRRFPAMHLVLVEYAFIGAAVLLRHNLFSCVYMLLHQFESTIKLHDLSMAVFPFFLIPSGLADLFGFQSQNQELADPWGSIAILVGLVLLLACAFVGVRQARRGWPFACLLLVELVLAAKLFHDGEDFGLYKLAMFIQPPLMAGLAWLFLRLPRSTRAAPAALGAFFVLTAPTGLKYTEAATGNGAGGFVELRNGSSLMAQEAPPAAPAGAICTSGIDNVVAVELAASYYRGADIRFLSNDFYATSTLFTSEWAPLAIYPHREVFTEGRRMLFQRDRAYTRHERLFGAEFTAMREPAVPTSYLRIPAELSLFNKAHPSAQGSGGLFAIEPPGSGVNRLIFVHSTRGLHYYSFHYTPEERRNIAFFQQEPDFFDPDGACNGVGRFFLLEVRNPTAPLYLECSLTTTVMGTGRTQLPPDAAILGARPVPMGLVGNGAAHRIVGPITPVWRDGAAFIAVDFGRPPSPLAYKRHGLKSLYHRQVPLDYRWLVSYARDFSALSAAERDALPRPREIQNFPQDLVLASGLEYSGAYEDGWLSPESDFVLGAAKPGEVVRLRGYVPELPGRRLDGDLLVSVNGGDPIRLGARIGDFDWLLPVSHPGPRTEVTLRWSATGILPHGDDRPVGAKLDGLTITAPVAKADFSRPGTTRPASAGVDQDGWAGKDSTLFLAVPPGSGGVSLNLSYPGWPGTPADNAVSISIDGGPPMRRVLRTGLNRINLPLKPGEAHRLELRPSKTFVLPGADGRERAFQLLSLEMMAGGPA